MVSNLNEFITFIIWSDFGRSANYQLNMDIENIIVQLTTSLNVTIDPISDCSDENIINIQQLFPYALIPAGAFIVILSFTVQRQKLFPNFCQKRPGIIIPYNGTECYEHRIAAVASTVVAVRFMMDCVFGKLIVIPENTPAYIKGIWSMVNVLILCIIYYPFIASFTVGQVISYFIGTIYVWLYAAATFWDKWTYCPQNNNDTSFLISMIEDAPILLCLFYLMIKLPYRLINKIRQQSSCNINYKKEDIPHVQYVKYLLNLHPTFRFETSRWNNFYAWFIHNIYKPVPGFRYSFRILCSLTVGLLIIYELNIRWFNAIFTPYPDCALSKYKPTSLTSILSYQCYLNLACVNVAVGLCDVIVVFVVYHILICYRQNLLEMYQGNYRSSRLFNQFNNIQIMVGCILYPGYQAASMIWGFMLQVLFVCILLIIPMQIFVGPLLFSYGNVITEFLLTILPVSIFAIIFWSLQYLLAKYYFTMNNGQILAIDNRKCLFNFMYFMFYYNIINGTFSNLWRFIKTVFFGVWFFPRLDTSLLPHRFEEIDWGFCNYIQFLLIENLQNNPVMITFLYLINKKEESQQLSINTCELPSRGNISYRKTACYNRWWLAVTLSRNPSLQLLRSHNLGILKALQRRLKIQSNILNWKLTDSLGYQSNNYYDYKYLDTFINFMPEYDQLSIHQLKFNWKELRKQETNEEDNQQLLIKIDYDNLLV